MNALFLAARTASSSIGNGLHRRHRSVVVVVCNSLSRHCHRPTRTMALRPRATTSTRSASDEGATMISTDGTTTRAVAEGLAASRVDVLGGGTRCASPRTIFPWRSSSDALPRLIVPRRTTDRVMDGNGGGGGGSLSDDDSATIKGGNEEYYESDYFTRGGPLGPGWPSPMESWFRGALYLTSMNLLGLSWPRIVLPWTRRRWERDVEWAFCNAFSNGVSGMIQDTYRLHDVGTAADGTGPPGERSDRDADALDDDEAFDVDVDISLDPRPLDEKGHEHHGASATDDRYVSHDDTAGDDEYCMLQRDLRRLYESARENSHPSRVNIVLRTVPYSARIESMFPIFGLSRSLVEDHPNLRHTYRNYLKRLQAKHKEAVLSGKSRLNPVEVGSFVMDGLQEVMEKSAKLSADGKATITIVAQVSIKCREVFCVKDVESGDIIQGHGDPLPRDVTHLVRFEMVVRERLATDANAATDGPDGGDWELEIGRWQITDWDDLLDGNVFFT